jgi:hypothetical protein
MSPRKRKSTKPITESNLSTPDKDGSPITESNLSTPDKDGSPITESNPFDALSTPITQSAPATPDKKTTPTISRSTLFKFIFFSLLVLILPLATFFTVRSLLDRDARGTSIAAISAVIAVNIVALLYIVVAFREESIE